MPPQLKNDPISLISICTCSVITSVFTLLKHESESSAGQKASFTKRETGWGVILKRGRSDMPVTSQCLVSKKLVELHTMSQEFKLYVPIVKHSHTVILPLFNILSLNYRWCQCALSFSVLEWDWNLKRPYRHVKCTPLFKKVYFVQRGFIYFIKNA